MFAQTSQCEYDRDREKSAADYAKNCACSDRVDWSIAVGAIKHRTVRGEIWVVIIKDEIASRNI